MQHGHLVTALAVGVLCWAVSAQTESVSASSELDGLYTLTGIDPELEPDLNCEIIRDPRSGLMTIVPNDDSQNEERTAQLKRVAQQILREGVFAGPGSVTALLASGVVHATEVELWLPETGAPSPRLSLTVEIKSQGPLGTCVLLARIYFFDAAQFATRKAALENMIGHPMRQSRVWDLPAVGTSSEGGKLQILGSHGAIFGAVSSSGPLEVTGASNVIHGMIHASGTVALAPSTQYLGITEPSLLAPPCPMTHEDARTLSQLSGNYVASSVTYSGSSVPPEGLTMVEGNLTVDIDSLDGSYTFMASGKIELRGEGWNVTPAVVDALAVSFSGRVTIDTECSQLEGEVHAVRTQPGVGPGIKVRGSNNIFHGVFTAKKIEVSGGFNLISDGTHPFQN